MNLYLTADGRYVGTQAEAKKAGKGWTPETVPTDKEGLIDYLNGLAAGSKLSDPPVANPFADDEPTPAPTPKPVAPVQRDYTADQIVEFLLDRASQAQVEAVFSAIGARWGEAR